MLYITVLYIRPTGGRAGKIPGVPAQETVWSNWKISREFVQIPDLANLKQAEGGVTILAGRATRPASQCCDVGAGSQTGQWKEITN